MSLFIAYWIIAAIVALLFWLCVSRPVAHQHDPPTGVPEQVFVSIVAGAAWPALIVLKVFAWTGSND